MIIAGKNRCIKCMKLLENSRRCIFCGFDESMYESSMSALKPGTCLNNRYFIGCVIGQGGFGITYSAWDIMLTIKVAVKEYYPQGMVGRGDRDLGNTHVIVQNNESTVKYNKGMHEFLQEARNMAQFENFRGIVAVREYFCENNTAYIAMEYVDGIPISSYIRHNGPLKGEQLLEKMEPILDSLELIHGKGYLHRDISANNIMFTTEGQLKLIDFGAARVIENEDITITVSVKHGYSPAEQYRTKGKLGPWTDIYSVCATMYYMLTGTVPDDSIERVFEDKVKPLTEYDLIDLDVNVKQAIDKGMSVNPEDRYDSIRELYSKMYPDKKVKREGVTFSEMPAKNVRSAKKMPTTMTIKGLLNVIRDEQDKRKRKIRYSISVTVLLFIVCIIWAVCIGFNNNHSEKSEPVSIETSEPTPELTNIPVAIPTVTVTPTPTATPTPTVTPIQTAVPKDQQKPNKKTTMTPKPSAKPTQKPKKKKTDKKNVKDNSVGTLDGL